MSKISKRATLLKEYKNIAASHGIKAYIHFCFDDEDSFEDEIDDYIAADLALFKSW